MLRNIFLNTNYHEWTMNYHEFFKHEYFKTRMYINTHECSRIILRTLIYMNTHEYT